MMEFDGPESNNTTASCTFQMMQTYRPASRIGDRQTNHKRERFMSNPLGMHANYARLSITGEYLILANRLFGLMEFDGPISNNTKADRPIQKEK